MFIERERKYHFQSLENVTQEGHQWVTFGDDLSYNGVKIGVLPCTS